MYKDSVLLYRLPHWIFNPKNKAVKPSESVCDPCIPTHIDIIYPMNKTLNGMIDHKQYIHGIPRSIQPLKKTPTIQYGNHIKIYEKYHTDNYIQAKAKAISMMQILPHYNEDSTCISNKWFQFSLENNNNTSPFKYDSQTNKLTITTNKQILHALITECPCCHSEEYIQFYKDFYTELLPLEQRPRYLVTSRIEGREYLYRVVPLLLNCSSSVCVDTYLYDLLFKDVGECHENHYFLFRFWNEALFKNSLGYESEEEFTHRQWLRNLMADTKFPNPGMFSLDLVFFKPSCRKKKSKKLAKLQKIDALFTQLKSHAFIKNFLKPPMLLSPDTSILAYSNHVQTKRFLLHNIYPCLGGKPTTPLYDCENEMELLKTAEKNVHEKMGYLSLYQQFLSNIGELAENEQQEDLKVGFLGEVACYVKRLFLRIFLPKVEKTFQENKEVVEGLENSLEVHILRFKKIY